MTLQTDRLILRPWREDDAAALYKYARDPRVGPAAGWAPHTDVRDSLSIIREVLSKPETYAITLKNDDTPLGSIGLMFDRPDFTGSSTARSAEIGYWIGVPFWGNGYVPEAMRELMRYAVDTLGIETILCGYFDGNDKSARVQEKCGLTYNGTRENVPCTGLNETRTEHFTSVSAAKWRASRYYVQNYIEAYIRGVRGAFGRRLAYVGLQGSYRRGEATRDSDIDLMTVIDGFCADDLNALQLIGETLCAPAEACGFVCGTAELANWNRTELCLLTHETLDLYAELSPLVPAYTADDVRTFVSLNTGNIYHALTHTAIHKSEDELYALLPALYKQTFYILQARHYLECGEYILSRAQLMRRLTGADRELLCTADALRAGSRADPQRRFIQLFEWCRGILSHSH